LGLSSVCNQMTFTRLFRLALLAALFALAAAPARADDFDTLVGALGSDTFAEKEKAIVGLGTLGDARAVPALQAMSEDRLRSGPNGQVVIVAPDDATRLIDAATGKPLPDLAARDTNRIIVNNRLRGSIEAALGGLTLFSKDRDTRLGAARDALKHPSAEVADRLKKAIASETDGEVRTAMQKSLYAAQLAAGSKDEQFAAVAALAGDTDPRVKSVLDEFAARPNLDPDLRKATDAAIASVNRRLQMVGIVANLFQGISLGSILLLAAIGLAITFGVMGVINMAHGEMIMIGAYVAYVVQQFFRGYLPPGVIDGYLIVAVPVAFLFAGGLGVILERCLIRFLYGRPLETLLATWGVSLILQQAVRSVFGSPNKEVSNPSWMTGGFDPIGGFTVTWNRIYIIIFCFVVLGVLALILNRTRFGLYMRAVTQNRDMARAMGIRTARVDALTFGLGSGIAGMAGVALSQIGNVSPNLGQIYIVDSFLVVVFGGVGNLMGTLIGALSLGVVNKVLEPFAGAILGKIVVLVAIILFIQRRPRGLFALKGRTAET
jgi:urea transport system permease protein